VTATYADPWCHNHSYLNRLDGWKREDVMNDRIDLIHASPAVAATYAGAVSRLLHETARS
jgi:hypothetical protein